MLRRARNSNNKIKTFQKQGINKQINNWYKVMITNIKEVIKPSSLRPTQ